MGKQCGRQDEHEGTTAVSEEQKEEELHFITSSDDSPRLRGPLHVSLWYQSYNKGSKKNFPFISSYKFSQFGMV